MNSKLGLKIFSAAACIAVWGCMATNNDADAEARASNANTLKFAESTSASLAKLTGISVEGQGEVDIGAAMRAAGVCEKFVGMIEDLTECGEEGSECEDGLPQSLLDFISCFGVKIGEDGEENAAAIEAKLANFSEFQSCVCGGSGSLIGSYDHLKWQTFSASASVAAGAAFSASQSSVTGNGGFEGSSSTVAGDAYVGSSSSVTGSK